MAEPDPALRLTPRMTSFRNLVMQVIREYFARHGRAPSQGEIVAAIPNATRDRVKKTLLRLEADGDIRRERGKERGITLPDEREAAIRTLRRHGVMIDEQLIDGPARSPIRPLRTIPVLTYRDAMMGGDAGAEQADDGQDDTAARQSIESSGAGGSGGSGGSSARRARRRRRKG